MNVWVWNVTMSITHTHCLFCSLSPIFPSVMYSIKKAESHLNVNGAYIIVTAFDIPYGENEI